MKYIKSRKAYTTAAQAIAAVMKMAYAPTMPKFITG
jgi:hypothetical protein